MKLALIADVHGNLEALQAVLDDLAQQCPDAHVVCAGDVVGYGADPEECLDLLLARKATIVAGNHEQMVLGCRDLSQCSDAAAIAAVWTRLRLGTQATRKLSQLPSWAEPVDGVLVCHGNLRDAGMYVSNAKQARQALEQLHVLRKSGKVLVCGHTHRAMFFTPSSGAIYPTGDVMQSLSTDEPCVVNPGAVGQARDGMARARYAVLDLDRQSIHYLALPYDHERALAKMRKTPLVAQVVLSRERALSRRLTDAKARCARAASELVTTTQATTPHPCSRPGLTPVAELEGVAAVIVTYNSRAVIGAALHSLEPSFRAGLLSECVVVDNLSMDGTADFVREAYPWARVIESGANVGFGPACNIGIEHTRATYVLLLNPDASLTQPDLERLVACMAREPRAGAAAPAIRQSDGRLQPAGGMITPGTLLAEALARPAKGDRRVIEPGSAPYRTSWLCGAVVLLRRSMLDDVGTFDPRYFLYFEETDLWLRAQRKGWELWAVGEATAMHVQGASARTVTEQLYQGCVPEHFFRSRFLYLRKHFGWTLAALAEATEVGAMALRMALRPTREDHRLALRGRMRSPLFGVG